MLDWGTCPREVGPPGHRLSRPGERERNTVMGNRVGVNMLQFCSVSNSLSHTTLSIKWEVYFSKELCRSSLLCRRYDSAYRCVCIVVHGYTTVVIEFIITKNEIKEKYYWFLSLSVFGLLSSSLLLFPQRFGRYVLWLSSGVCRTREPSRNFELRPLSYLPTPPLGQDMTQGQFLSGV